ncbi:MAG TPA: flagellar hook-basal body complex protein FliE [Anaerolineae bacterium]|nr:flagellar hook-basal body complex protein FliE [Anaerolineae bacterium]
MSKEYEKNEGVMDVERISSLLGSLRSQQTLSPGQPEGPRSRDATGGSSSESAFVQVLDGLTKAQEDADRAIELLVKGEPVDLHQVMISAETADIAFRLAVQLRNKLVRAYEEIMRMQV